MPRKVNMQKVTRKLGKSISLKNKVYTERVPKPETQTQRTLREKSEKLQQLFRPPPAGQSAVMSTLPQSFDNTQNLINNNNIQESDREENQADEELFYTKDQMQGLGMIKKLDGLKKNELIQVVKMQQFKLDM